VNIEIRDIISACYRLFLRGCERRDHWHLCSCCVL